jgi:hypothetical protein
MVSDSAVFKRKFLHSTTLYLFCLSMCFPSHRHQQQRTRWGWTLKNWVKTTAVSPEATFNMSKVYLTTVRIAHLTR